MLTQRVKHIIEENNGILSLKQAEEKGVSKEALRQAYKRGELYKEDRGIYLLDKSYSDEMYTLQLKFSKGVYSHESAVMLHGLSTYSPFVYHLTFPRGYHLSQAKKYSIKAHHCQSNKFNIGVIEMESWHGNLLNVTNLERTVIDILKAKEKVPGIEEEMIDNYLWREEKDIDKLKEYAEIFKVYDKIEEKVLSNVK